MKNIIAAFGIVGGLLVAASNTHAGDTHWSLGVTIGSGGFGVAAGAVKKPRVVPAPCPVPVVKPVPRVPLRPLVPVIAVPPRVVVVPSHCPPSRVVYVERDCRVAPIVVMPARHHAPVHHHRHHVHGWR
jgi:hypothetical protein